MSEYLIVSLLLFLQGTRIRKMDPSLENKNKTNYYEYVHKKSIKPDVEIVLKDDKVLKAHKEVLGSQNPVFLDEFLSEPDLKVIEIVDLDPEAVKNFITFLYTGNIPDGNVNEELFMVAHKYINPNLKNVCRKKLSQDLTMKNAVDRFLAFFYCKEKKLIKETSMFLAKNFNDVKMYSDFDKVFINQEATNVIFDAFDSCKITVLSEDRKRKKLIKAAKKSDLTIKVQGYSFLGHKEILSTTNTIFKTVIPALPKIKDRSSSIDIPDFDPKTFGLFLKYIYTKDVDKTADIKKLLIVAHQYVDSKLMQICEKQLVSTLLETNVVDLLLLGAEVKSQKLTDVASKFIVERMANIKEQDAFQKVRENPLAFDAVCCQFTNKLDSLQESLAFHQKTNSYAGEFSLTLPEDDIFSEPFYMSNVPWKIQLANNKSNLGIYLCCSDAKLSFSGKVTFSLTLVSSVGRHFNITFSTTCEYSGKNLLQSKFSSVWGWGWLEFVSLTELKNKTKGYLTDGKVKVEVDAKVVH